MNAILEYLKKKLFVKKEPRTFIGFVGFKHVKSFITKEQVRKIIYFFFEQKGLPLDKNPVNIYIRFICDYCNDEFGYGVTCARTFHYYNRHTFLIDFFTKSIGFRVLYKDEFLVSLIHELDHVLWTMEGKLLDGTLPYLERPQEIRAFKTQEEFITVLKKHGLY